MRECSVTLSTEIAAGDDQQVIINRALRTNGLAGGGSVVRLGTTLSYPECC